jgi:hypothetical protein
MDIYVIMNRDVRVTVVCGAATDWATACDLANRDRDSQFREWTGWSGEDAGQTSRRYALGPGGRRLYTQQEIVRVPLAGMVETGELPLALAAAVRTAAMNMPIEYATEISEIGRQFGAP